MGVRRLDQPGTLTTRLGFVPEGQQLNLTLALDEPAGGLLARAADIPGLPPVKLELSGQGTLEAFQAKLTFEAGAGIEASGNAALTRDGPARRLGFDLAAQVSGLLPIVAAPVFAGTTKLLGTVAFSDDGSVTIPGITLAATAAKLDVTGSIDARQLADLKITAANVPTGESRTTVAGADIRHLAFDGRITGALAAPTVDAALTAEAAQLPAGRLGKLDATFKATPTGGASADGTLIQLTGNARATGLTLTDKALAQAVGTEVSLMLRGTGAMTGLFNFETLELKSPTITGRFAGRAGSSEVQGRLGIDVPDLAKFGDVAGLVLRGSTTLSAEVEGTPRANRFNAKIDGHATQFATGIAAVDGLSGGKLDVAGGVRLEPNGSIGFDRVRLSGAYAQGWIAGAATPERADVAVVLTIPTLARADDRLTGRAEINAKLTGTLEHPGTTARIAISDATALGRPVPRLALEATVKDIRGALDARVTLDGEIDRKPARGDLHVTRQAGGGTTLDGADITIGSVDVRGSVILDRQNLATGQVAVKARDLDDLSPLVLKKLSGALEADVSLAAIDGGQNVQLTAAGQRIEVYGFRLDRLATDLSLTDVYRRPVVVGKAEIDQASIGGETISRVRLRAQGTPQASDITLTAAAGAFDLDARARIIPGDRTRVEIAQFGATRGQQRVALVQPTTLTVVDGGVDVGNLALGLGGGRLMLSGIVGSRLALKANARAIPLSAVEIFVPGLGVAGTLNGSAEISGAASTPTGPYRLHLANLVAPQTRSAGLLPIDVAASGRIEETRATVEATVSAGRAGTLNVGGSAPLARTGTLDLTVRGNLDVGLANTSLGASGRRVTGSIAIDGRVAGTIERPQASGSATLSGGTFSDAMQGTRLDNIRGRLVTRGEDVSIESASATTRNGGQINASGRIRLDPAGGFPGAIRINGRRAELVQTPSATAVLNLDLNLTGPLARDPRVSGRIEVVSLDITVAERLPATLRPLPGTKHLHSPRTVAARLALQSKTQSFGQGVSPVDPVLDLTITAPGHILVHGRGLDAELGGSLRLTGTLTKPNPVGAFSLRRGRLSILTSRLEFIHGNITFAGDFGPELDFLARTQAGGATIETAVTGQASDPQFAFTSSPDLPQDEILSRLLFGTPSGQLTTGQALALAQAAAQYSGGDGAFESLRRALGLGGLDVNLGASGGPSVGLQRALNSRVSVGVKAGATAAQTGVGVDVRVTDKVKVQGEVGSNGAASVGIGAEYEW
jgi:translocation and assembly module TamB